ncbi:MAG: CRISPR system precrRNA processing endoribonuclease RAMP protein Cas6, partial [Candidatus Binatia bacterium]
PPARGSRASAVPATTVVNVPPLDLPPVLALGARFRALEDQRLPPFLGSALHGAFGRALKDAVCVAPEREACPGCSLFASCAYPLLFETPAPASGPLEEAGVRDQAPRPVAVAPEPGWTRPSGKPVEVKTGEMIPLHVVLIGRAIAYLPAVLQALCGSAERGFGVAERARRARLSLDIVATQDGSHKVYERGHGYLGAPPLENASESSAGGDAVTLEIVTPIRLKEDGRLSGTITPRLFFRTLARRANALSILFGNGRAAVDEDETDAQAREIKVVRASLRRVHVRRYSARQSRRMEWPGLMGRVEWKGEALASLWPLLSFGEAVQIGKGTALGFGRYRVVEPGSRRA